MSARDLTHSDFAGLELEADRRVQKFVGQRTHGMRRTRTYRSWASMKVRCQCTTDPNYAGYGGKGITVCERWQTFEGFLQDMGPRPPGTSLDRIDNNGNYEPDNCRWATMEVQMSNRSNTVYLTHEGRTLPLKEWSRLTGLSAGLLRQRHFSGWDDVRVLTQPVQFQRKQPRGASA